MITSKDKKDQLISVFHIHVQGIRLPGSNQEKVAKAYFSVLSPFPAMLCLGKMGSDTSTCRTVPIKR